MLLGGAGEKDLFGVSFLEVVGSDFSAGNLGGDGENRNAAAVTVVETIDEVKISGATASGAYGKLSADLGLATRGESGYFFVADHLPINAIVGTDGVGEAVEGVASYTIDAFDAGFQEGFYEDVGDFGEGIFLPHGELFPFLLVTTYRFGCRDSRWQHGASC